MFLCVCVYMAEVRIRLLTRSSLVLKVHPQRENNAFVSSAKSVCLQHKMCSLLAINMLICSVILYLEVSNTDYLVAGDERVRLQCDI